MKYLHDCFEVPGCSDGLPKHCEGCLPEKPQRPQAIDPDGFVFDVASVNAREMMTQSIITQPWVTITQRTATGTFVPWNGQRQNQSNPQYTDSLYPHKVLIPGYYLFLVQPDEYHIRTTADGYLPYETIVIRIVDSAVRLNVSMERGQGVLTTVSAAASNKMLGYLPLIYR